MNTSAGATSVAITTTATVVNGEPMPWHTGLEFLPSSIEVLYQARPGDVGWNISVMVSGVNWLPGEKRTGNKTASVMWRCDDAGDELPRAPQWVQDFVDAHEPPALVPVLDLFPEHPSEARGSAWGLS